MQSLDDFSQKTHVSKYTIYQLSENSDMHYKTYDLPKKSGGTRTIYQPSKNLKGIQSWILVNILNKLKVSSSSKGFEKNSSILENAIPHKDANTIINLDLKDFFPSISSNKVFSIFHSVGYNNLICTILTNLCTVKNQLPQGSPCSPKLANLSVWTLDLRIQGYVGKRGIRYTRYADDLTFSGLNPKNVIKILPLIKEIIEEEGFKINNSKTRIAGPARARRVTGLVISDRGIGIGKKKYKLFRSKIHHLTLASEQSNEELLRHVQGWLAYIRGVDRKRYSKALNYIKSLDDKCPGTLVGKIIV